MEQYIKKTKGKTLMGILVPVLIVVVVLLAANLQANAHSPPDSYNSTQYIRNEGDSAKFYEGMFDLMQKYGFGAGMMIGGHMGCH